MSGTNAREVIAHEIQMGWHANADAYEVADAVLTALGRADYLVLRDSFATGR